MRRVALIVLLIVASCALFSACSKSETGTANFDGIYKGSFQRQVNGVGDTSTVSLECKGGKWVGQSNRNKYPALCTVGGTYKTDGATGITFFDECAYTADFDWTFILRGAYNIKINGTNYMLIKEYSNGTKDIFNLIKQ